MAFNSKVKNNLTVPKKGEVRNPNGRPRKSISSVAKSLLDAGVEIPSNSDIRDMYLLLMNQTKAELVELVKDELQPIFIRQVGRAILSGQGLDIIEKILDRAHGKATQRTEVTGKEGADLVTTIKIVTVE